MSLEGKAALVTGGGRGVGAACARALADRGADVGLIDAPGELSTPAYELTTELQLEGVAETIRSVGRGCVSVAADVRDHAAVRAAVERVQSELGGIDMLVAAAGIRSAASAGSMTDAQWDETIDVNLHGVYHAMRATVPAMIERGGGRIVVIAGDEGRRGAPRLAHQAAADWAAIGLAKSVAIETADSGVAVNAVCVSPLDTKMFGTPESWRQAAGEEGAGAEEAEHALRLRHPRSKAYAPVQKVVETALFLLAQPGEELTGSVVDVSMGLSALNSA